MAAFLKAKESSEREALLLNECQAKALSTKEALTTAQFVASTVQAVAHQKIADIVSKSLSAVFNNSYEFRVVFAEKRGRTEASLIFTRDQRDIDPMGGAGGGVVSIASFALRLSCLLLSNPPVRKLLILDEPFCSVSAEFRDRVSRLLRSLSKELGVQMVIVTHLRELIDAKAVQL